MPHIRPFTFQEGPAETGQYATLHCSVTFGDLPLNISWLHNDMEINDSMGISMMMVSKRTSVLTIEFIDDHHAGNYTCVAENHAGIQKYSTELNVYG